MAYFFLFDLNTGHRLEWTDFLNSAFSNVLNDSISFAEKQNLEKHKTDPIDFNFFDSTYFVFDSIGNTSYDSISAIESFSEIANQHEIVTYCLSLDNYGKLSYNFWNSCCPAHRIFHTTYFFTFPKKQIKKYLKKPYLKTFNFRPYLLFDALD